VLVDEAGGDTRIAEQLRLRRSGLAAGRLTELSLARSEQCRTRSRSVASPSAFSL
jgi:hypothetical protein